MLGKAPFESMDEDTARQSLEGFLEVMQAKWTPTFASGDLEGGAHFDGKGNVTLPKGYKEALDGLLRRRLEQLELPEQLGGFGAPPTVRWAAFELMAGANPSVCFYVLGCFMTTIIDALGTPAQKKRYVQNMVDKHWGATMVLTEPGAGSDVGAGTTKATHVAGDEYLLEGVKRFITNGDFDHPENIVHIVLARPEGKGPGTKGLSCFIVPKVWVEEDGSLGARNGAVVTKVEHKMGIKGSATCELTLGDGVPCRALLLGEVHDGIAQMFHVIEYARMGVGTKSMATLSTAYLNALEYTRVRKQGPDLAKQTDKAAPRVEIIRHPDVRRMLMLQKAFAEGLRAIVLWTAHVQDQVVQQGGHGAEAAKALDRLERPDAAADQGLRLGEGLRAARAVAAVLRRLGLLPGLSDRAVHPRSEDRFAVRGHDRDPGARSVLPQDRARSRRDAAGAARRRSSRRSSSCRPSSRVEKEALARGARRRAGHHGRDARQARAERLSRRAARQSHPVLARRARDRLAARGDRRRSRTSRLATAQRRTTRRSTPASSRARGSTRSRCCRSSRSIAS